MVETDSSHQEKEDGRQIGRKVARNSVASMGAVGIYFLSRLALTPFILHYVNLTEFGLWSMCFVILSYVLRLRMTDLESLRIS